MKGLKTKLVAVACAATMVTASAVPAVTTFAATTTKVATVKTTSGTGYANTAVCVRSGAGKTYKVIVTLKKKDVVRVIGNKAGWLKVLATHNGKSYKGYMGAQFVTLKSTTVKKTVKFNKVMRAIYDVNAGSAGSSLRAKSAIKVMKQYASTLSGTNTRTSSFSVLAKKWLKDRKHPKAVKAVIKENIEEVQDNMNASDSTDVLYGQILSGIDDAC